MNKLQLFQNSRDYQTFVPGQTIFREGQPGEAMYVVIEGEVDVIIGDKILTQLGPGELMGEMALVDASSRSATCIARTYCKLVPINLRRFAYLVEQTPYFAIQVMQTMAERLRFANIQLQPKRR